MGIYDRDYYQQQRPGLTIRPPGTVVGVLIVINVAIWVVDGLFFPATGPSTRWLSEAMAIHGPGKPWPETLTHPWMWWQFITYGFAHSAAGFGHVFWNMFGLFMFGRAVESRLGGKELLRFYLLAIVLGSLMWAIVTRVTTGANPAIQPALLGASGAVTGVIILFVLYYPHETILLFFVLPVPAWVLGVMVILGNVFGATGYTGETNVAYGVHLVGAAFAFLYYQQKWRLSRFSLPTLKSRPKLRVHDPDDKDDKLQAELDRILEKIHREGEASLTRKERRTLKNASIHFQQRRRQ